MAIDNWPPGSIGISIHPPQEMIQTKLDAIDELDAARAAITAWRREAEQARHDAWVLYHDKHGWPNDVQYKSEMLRNASSVVRKAREGGAPWPTP